MVWQDNATLATPATMLVPKQYRQSSSLGSTGRVERAGMLLGQQFVFHKPSPGHVAPLERTLQRYSIVSCRHKVADDDGKMSIAHWTFYVTELVFSMKLNPSSQWLSYWSFFDYPISLFLGCSMNKNDFTIRCIDHKWDICLPWRSPALESIYRNGLYID